MFSNIFVSLFGLALVIACIGLITSLTGLHFWHVLTGFAASLAIANSVDIASHHG